ncbi:MAG: spermidine synthase [Bdellovibrionales bacterium]
MSYELLLAKLMGELFGQEVLCQSLTVGTFLLGLGFGSWRASDRAGDSSRQLVGIELGLAVLGATAPLLIMTLVTLTKVLIPEFIIQSEDQQIWMVLGLAFLQPLPFLIGWWSGWELPLIIKASQGVSHARILAGSYWGGMFGSWFVPWAGWLHMSVAQAAWLVGAVNWATAFVLLLWLLPNKSRALSHSLLAWFALLAVITLQAPLQRAYLVIHYGQYALNHLSQPDVSMLWRIIQRSPPVQRVISSYQNIDLVDESFFSSMGLVGDFTLYLNKKPQFSAKTFRSYHESMVLGALNLAKIQPREVVIFGGGDGLIAAELLKLPFIEKITLIELDPVVIQLAKQDPRLLKLNERSLFDAKVEVIIDDAFRFLRERQQPLTAVFIDFPYPDSFDTTKLFSREFFGSLLSKLDPGGFAVLDAPFWRVLSEDMVTPRPWPQDLLLSTIQAAGIKNYLLFGPIEPFLYIATDADVKLRFDYSLLPATIESRSLVNMTDIRHLLEDTEIRPEYVNSIFKPRRWR